MTNNKNDTPGLSWAVPEELGVPPDKLRLRLDFFHQATTMTFFAGDTVTTRVVDALDVAHALASDMTFGTGLLPEGALWWTNTKSGPVTALYAEPQVWKIALEVAPGKPPKRFVLPLPGLVFLLTPNQAPWVYAVKKKPTKMTDIIYKAPLANIYNNGRSCPGSHKYPSRVADMIQSFFMAFFSMAGDRGKRSVKYPKDVLLLWDFLNGKKKYPMEDLVPHGTIRDLMTYKVADSGDAFIGAPLLGMATEDEDEDE
ncbi:MAG: hypothetical protein Q8O55_07380 [Dehalococcoidales bacterium]|nr:hypothetical protein [Dehalococcoidales bacterium]